MGEKGILKSLLDMDARPFLHEYFARIGVRADEVATPSLRALRLLHERHVCAIPFESFDVVLKGQVRIDLPSIVEKLVRQRRGGYCFENNKLFGAVLLTLGYEVEHKRARVYLDNGTPPADAPPYVPLENHMVNLVRVPGEEGTYLCDVGFGSSQAPRFPVLMAVDEVQSQYTSRYRLTATEKGVYSLWQQFEGKTDEWLRIYTFNAVENICLTDYYVGNLYTYLCPDSLFVETRWICRFKPDGNGIDIMEENTLKERDGSGKAVKTPVTSPEQLRDMLLEKFDVPLTLEEATTVFRANAHLPPQTSSSKKSSSNGLISCDSPFANPACLITLIFGVAVGIVISQKLKGL